MADFSTKLKAFWKKLNTRAPKKNKGPIVGYDGGHQVVKVVRLRGVKPPLTIEDAFVEVRGQGTEGAVALKLRERGYVTLPAAFSLADENVETHGFRLPKLAEDELSTAVNWEIKKTIASPDYVYHDVLTFDGPSNTDVECVVASRDVVNAIYETGEKSGLQPKYLETESSALLACVRALKNPAPNRMAVIDLGFSSFRLVFLHGGRVSMTRSLYFGLGSLSGVTDGTKVAGNERGIQEGLYNLCEEFRRSEFFAKDKKGLEDIDEIVLCGGGATLKPVVDYLLKHLAEKKISLLDPFEGTPELPPAVNRELGPIWAVAVGLALREVA